jgi:hypothetical protein
MERVCFVANSSEQHEPVRSPLLTVELNDDEPMSVYHVPLDEVTASEGILRIAEAMADIVESCMRHV